MCISFDQMKIDIEMENQRIKKQFINLQEQHE